MAATCCRSCAFSRCCQSGVRWPGRRRGSSRPRAAFSRKRAANSGAGADPARTTRSSTSSGAISARRSIGGAASASGSRMAIPSSDQIASTSRPSALAHPSLDRHRPGGVDPAAERRQQADPPVAQLVAEALEHDRAVVGHDPGRLALVVEVGGQVAGRALVELAANRRRSAGTRLARRPRPARSGRPRPSPFQNGILPGTPAPATTSTRSRVISSMRHEVAPSRNTSPCARLVHHLLVELADARRRSRPGTRRTGRGRGSVPPETTASRWAPSRPRMRVGDAVPDDPRPQLRELVAGVAAGEHVEHALELRRATAREGLGAAHHVVQVVHPPLVHRRRRHDLLGEHVQRLARAPACVRSRPRASRRVTTARLQQVAPDLGKMPPLRRLPDLVPGPADPLEAARDRLRRLDLHDQVDGAHVDAQLERRGGHQRRQLAGLQRVLDLAAAARGRSSRGGRGATSSLGQLVEAVGHALGQRRLLTNTIVERWAADQLQQARVDAPARSTATRLALDGRRRAQLAHVLDRHHAPPASRSACADAGVDDRRPARRARRPGSAADLVQRPLRRGQADALRRLARSSAASRSSESARWAPRLVPASAWISSTITVSTSQHLPAPRR